MEFTMESSIRDLLAISGLNRYGDEANILTPLLVISFNRFESELMDERNAKALLEQELSDYKQAASVEAKEADELRKKLAEQLNVNANETRMRQYYVDKLASLSAKSGEGFKGWYQEYCKTTPIELTEKERMEGCWQASRLPLLAKIEEMDTLLSEEFALATRIGDEKHALNRKLAITVEALKSVRDSINNHYGKSWSEIIHEALKQIGEV